MAAKKGWGGPRKGAGRKAGFGKAPEDVRRNRVVVMLTDAELAALHRFAESRDSPLGTAAYELLSKGLRRVK